MAIFNALLNLRELKELYSGKPVCVCPLYKGVINVVQKTFEATGNPIILPEYKSLVKLKTTFSPKQAGTGDPSPENVRPISGYDSVTVTQSKDGHQVKQITLTLPETIYGGTVDAVTGVGEIQIAFMVLDGTENWVLTGATADTYQGFAISLPYTNVNYRMFCSHFIYNLYENVANTCSQQGKGKYNIRFVISTEIVPNKTVDEWKSYLAAQAAAGTPVQVAYKLATPESFKVSQVSIPSLRGENYFFTNGENMDIIYKKEYFWSDEA